MVDYAPLAFLLGLIAVAVAVAERSRRASRAEFSGASLPGYAGPTTVAVAGAEAVRLVRHPVTLLGLAGTVATTANSWSEPALGSRWLWLGFLLYPLLGGMFIASHLAVSRDHHAGMAELAASFPADTAQRTVGHLLAAAMLTVPIAVAWYIVVGARLGWRWTAPLEGNGWSATWEPGVVEMSQPLLVVAIVLSIAVAAGRWWRHPLAAILVPLLLLFSPLLWMVPLAMEGGQHGHWETHVHVGEVTTTQLAWHLVFLAGLLTLAVVGALLWDDRRRRFLALAALGLVAMVAGFGLQGTVSPG